MTDSHLSPRAEWNIKDLLSVHWFWPGPLVAEVTVTYFWPARSKSVARIKNLLLPLGSLFSLACTCESFLFHPFKPRDPWSEECPEWPRGRKVLPDAHLKPQNPREQLSGARGAKFRQPAQQTAKSANRCASDGQWSLVTSCDTHSSLNKWHPAGPRDQSSLPKPVSKALSPNFFFLCNSTHRAHCWVDWCGTFTCNLPHAAGCWKVLN